jgi:hypothetical protein
MTTEAELRERERFSGLTEWWQLPDMTVDQEQVRLVEKYRGTFDPCKGQNAKAIPPLVSASEQAVRKTASRPIPGVDVPAGWECITPIPRPYGHPDDIARLRAKYGYWRSPPLALVDCAMDARVLRLTPDTRHAVSVGDIINVSAPGRLACEAAEVIGLTRFGNLLLDQDLSDWESVDSSYAVVRWEPDDEGRDDPIRSPHGREWSK